MNNDLIIIALQRLNEALTAATVIVATSIAGIYPARRAAQLVLSHDE